MADALRPNELAQLLKGMAAEVRGFVGQAIAPIAKRQDEIARRLDALERAPMTYLGTYEAGREYPAKSFVTCDGSVWFCEAPTALRPGDGPAWQLAVKRGRDAPR